MFVWVAVVKLFTTNSSAWNSKYIVLTPLVPLLASKSQEKLLYEFYCRFSHDLNPKLIQQVAVSLR